MKRRRYLTRKNLAHFRRRLAHFLRSYHTQLDVYPDQCATIRVQLKNRRWISICNSSHRIQYPEL